MKEFLEEIKLDPDESFFIGIFQDHIDKPRWHYHQEYELSFITEGSGIRIVGDSNEEFNPGDLIFIGPRIPHVWYSQDSERRQLSGRTLESVYMLFDQDILPARLISLPEFTRIRRAMSLSERGIRITGDTLNEVSRLMLQLPYMSRFKRLIMYYEIMDIIGSGNNFVYLASQDYVKSRFSTSNMRINRIHEFMMKNYQNDIDLQEVAELVHMEPASVCRFFKQSTGMTVFEYLNKIKIDIVNISYDCGFNNLSHFNKQFRKFIGTTPTRFRSLRNPR